MICQRCNWLRGDGCTCVGYRERWPDVVRRHRQAVQLAAFNDQRRRLAAERELRRAS